MNKSRCFPLLGTLGTLLLAGLLPCRDADAQPASLTAWWAFEGDYTSEVNNHVYSGMAIGAGTSVGTAPNEFHVGTGGLRIDDSLATANYVSVGTTPMIGSSAATTVSAWYRLDDLAGNGMDTRNFIWETAPSDFPLSFGVRSDTVDGRKHTQWFTEAPAIGGDSNSLPMIDDGQWHHVAVVIDQAADTLKYYHNGSLTDDVSIPGLDFDSSNVTGFNIGNHRGGDGSRNWDGFIDDVAVFNGALSGTQVSSLYDKSATPLSVVGGNVTDPPPGPPPVVDGSWTMVVIPDTQRYAESYPDIFSNITTWIVANKESQNIGLVLQEGDITDNNNTAQWQNAKQAISILDGQVPYILATGNHDYGSNGGAGNRSTLFNDYFDERIYHDAGGQVFSDLAIVEQFEDVRRFGSGPENKTLENVAYRFDAPDGRELLVFSLEWGPRQEVVDWANAVASDPTYADSTAVLLTHAYTYSDNTRYDWSNLNTDNDQPGNTHSGSSQGANPHGYGTADTDDADPANDTNDGEELWRDLVSGHDTFEMVFSGHVIVGGQLGYLTSEGSAGQDVHQLLFNAQADANGGNGWIRLIEFLPDGETVQVKTYSPYLDAWRTDGANQFMMTISQVPEPSMTVVLVTGGLGLAMYGRWRTRSGV